MTSRATPTFPGALAATVLLAALAPLWPGRVSAQDTSRTPAAPDSARRAVPCTGQRVDYVVVHSSAPTIVIFKRVPVVADIVRSLHVTTKPEIIRRFVILEEGKPCTELRRTESERILRAQPFLADASVQAFPNDSGGVDLEVRAIDEASMVVGASVRSASPYFTAVRFGNSNVDGGGVYLAGNWRSGGVFRDGYGGRYVDYQVFGRPYILAMQAQRDPLGDHWDAEAAHPFLTDLQRIAWRARSGSSDALVYFEPVKDEKHAVRRERRYFDVGGIIRVGPPGRLSLFGASFSGEREMSAQSAVLVTRTGILPDTSSIFFNRYGEHRIARVNTLWGVRDIEFVQVQGFDALTATQDLPVGFQLGTLFGRSLGVLGSKDDDIFMSADLYVGAAARRAALKVQLQGEGRRSNDLNLWDGILTSGRIAQYLKLTTAQTVVLSGEWSGGWRMRSPFALTLGEEPGGVRGYANSTTPGGQRAIVRLEHRTFIGRPNGWGDAGIGFFADAGRLWAGDVPFGRSTPTRTAVGISLLGAVPPRSARLWRLDIALPLSGGGRRLEFRVVSSDRTTFFWREPRDIQFARESTVPSSIFAWP